MGTKQPGKAKKYDGFLSHASEDLKAAGKIQRYLEEQKLLVWMDQSHIQLGVLLRNELVSAIKDSRGLILLWSKAASKSRWVAAELLTAFHQNRFIIPCVLRGTPLPRFLQNSVFLKISANVSTKALQSLFRAIQDAPNTANDVPPLMASASPDLRQAIQALDQGQRMVTSLLLQWDIETAQGIQSKVDTLMQATKRKWGLDLMVLNLEGYHHKNTYMVRHWDAIQAGRPPKDPILVKSERCFFDALFVDPTDYSALNGLGSVLIYEQELSAAEFFIRRAIALGEKAGLDYSAAKHDLDLVLRFKT